MNTHKDSPTKHIIIGQIGASHGIKGWVKINSYAEPKENILNYSSWLIERNNAWQELTVESGRLHSGQVIVKFEGIDSPEDASALILTHIAILRNDFAPSEQDEYYWTDLEGLAVYNTENVLLGKVDHLFATGSNDIIVVEGARRYLIPFIRETVVHSIDLEKEKIVVDWDLDF